MSKAKDSVILYESFFDATADLSSEAIAELWKALGSYLKQNEANEAVASMQIPEAKLAWKFIKMQLDADRRKWNETCERRAEAGRLGGVRSGESRRSDPNQNEANEANASNAKQNEANEADTESESDTDNNIYIRQQREKQTKQIAESFTFYCPSLPQIRKVDKRRLSTVFARYDEYKNAFSDFAEFIKSTFQRVEASDFLTGRSSEWQASFDWIFNPTNFKKIWEGNYKNREGKKNGNAANRTNRNTGTYNENASGYEKFDE